MVETWDIRSEFRWCTRQEDPMDALEVETSIGEGEQALQTL